MKALRVEIRCLGCGARGETEKKNAARVVALCRKCSAEAEQSHAPSEREQLERPTLNVLKACDVCSYVACVCAFKDAHADDCTRRCAVLDEHPQPCRTHGVYACDQCFPCDCARTTKGTNDAKRTMQRDL